MSKPLVASFALVSLVTVLPSAEAKKPAAPAPAATPKLTREQLEESIPFELSDFQEAKKLLSKKLGAPKTASELAKVWYFDPKKNGSNTSCDEIFLLHTPYGDAITDSSILNGDPCVATKLTKKKVQEVAPPEKSEFAGRVMQSSVKYEAALASFESKLGKAQGKLDPMFDEYETVSWTYADDEGKCKYLTLVGQKGHSMFSKVWNLDCK